MIQTGLEQWIKMADPRLRKLRLGLVTMPAAVLPDLTWAVDALREAGFQLTALFGPEHGLGGAAPDGAGVVDLTDRRTGLPVYSLYGRRYESTDEMLAQIDAFVFDMQDVGVRFYTYLSTLFYVLKAAGKAGKPVYLLDRPNPIGGNIVEGGEIEAGFESFVGVVNLPIRHGMTLGELAGYLNLEYQLGADLQVVTMAHWQRQTWFDQTGLPWLPTSPAMPHLSTAILYPGMCLLEGTNLSLGRGTSLPFEQCGAPWLDGYALAEQMNALGLAGVRFRATVFTPSASNQAGLECYGVQVHVREREVFRPVTMALHLLSVARALSGAAWAWNPHFERLTGSGRVRIALETENGASQVAAAWAESSFRFVHQREKYLLY
ncbi:MAG: DUF1343 domain-containing protein [Anaerolineales bacterium]|jgi:uncharacterized protein YbbC (DUF1343 family)|nr:DUF1343 domain-containing protein [Anaerolineales bacterium]